MLNLLPYVQGHSSFMIIKNDLNKTLFLHFKQKNVSSEYVYIFRLSTNIHFL